jgi:hypothetical protein
MPDCNGLITYLACISCRCALLDALLPFDFHACLLPTAYS